MRRLISASTCYPRERSRLQETEPRQERGNVGGKTGSKSTMNGRGNQPGSEEGAGVIAMANGNGWVQCVDR